MEPQIKEMEPRAQRDQGGENLQDTLPETKS